MVGKRPPTPTFQKTEEGQKMLLEEHSINRNSSADTKKGLSAPLNLTLATCDQ